MHRLRLAALFLSLTAAPCAGQVACGALTVVAPFPAGSNTDAVARLIGERVAEIVGRPVVVDNKPGAEGQIAAADVRRAPPDGCRLLFATAGNLSIVPFTRREPPYDPLRDFTPIADVGRYTFVLFASPGVPVRDAKSFVDFARSRPDALNYATANNTNLLVFSHIQRQFGLRAERITYRGEPEAMTDLMQDRVQAMVATTVGVPHAREGRIRALAVLAPRRTPLLPDVPTFAEAGLGDPGIVAWAGIVGPAGLPTATVQALSRAFVSAMERDDAAGRAAALGFTLTPAPAERFAALMREQHAVYGRVIREIGLPVQ